MEKNRKNRKCKCGKQCYGKRCQACVTKSGRGKVGRGIRERRKYKEKMKLKK